MTNLESLSIEELQEHLYKLGAQRDATREQMIAAKAAMDRKLAEKAVADKLASFSPAEMEVLHATPRPGAAVGTLKANKPG